MLKVYILQDQGVLERMAGLLRSTLNGYVAVGRPLRVEISDEIPKRSNQHNKYYRALLRQCADEAWIEGKQFPPQAWAEFFKAKWLPRMDLPCGGSAVTSTTDLDRAEMLDLTNRIGLYMQQELGLTLIEINEPIGRMKCQTESR